MFHRAHFLLGILLLNIPSVLAAELKVSIDFPGGSGEVLALDQLQRSIKIRATQHKDKGWDCWWYIQVSGLAVGETLSLQVGKQPWATPDRAAISDDGKTWKQSVRGTRQGSDIIYRVPVTAATMWFAWGPPYVKSHADALVNEASRQLPQAKVFSLCETRAGHSTPAIRIASGKPLPEIWIQARQHAWESGSSWVGDGLLRWLVSDHPNAVALRAQANITYVPIMDLDSVMMGAGGKNQKPQDHNRDWTNAPHWPAVAAATEHIRRHDRAKRFVLFIDLHNPGAGSQAPFFYVPPSNELSKTGRANLREFIAAAQLEMVAPLSFQGKTIESGPGYDKKWKAISKNWVTFHTQPYVVAVTLETAWNTPDSTQTGYRHVGKCLGLAIERYLRSDPRKTN